jgi:hypothetical protein
MDVVATAMFTLTLDSCYTGRGLYPKAEAYTPEDSHLHICRHESLESTTVGLVYAGIPYRNLFLLLNFILALIYMYYIHLSFSFCEGGLYFCFASKKYTGTSKFPFRALMLLKNVGIFCAPADVSFSFLYSFLMYLFLTFTLCLISYVYF